MLKYQVNKSLEIKGFPDFDDLIDKVADTTLDYAKPEFGKPFAISLLLTGDDEIRGYNKQYRNLDKPTNVLSFAYIDGEDFEQIMLDSEEFDLGDIIISLETLQKEAKEKGISIQNHFCHILTHGLLHLLGFDHITDEDADEMEAMEAEILKILNINNPYEEQNE